MLERETNNSCTVTIELTGDHVMYTIRSLFSSFFSILEAKRSQEMNYLSSSRANQETTFFLQLHWRPRCIPRADSHFQLASDTLGGYGSIQKPLQNKARWHKLFQINPCSHVQLHWSLRGVAPMAYSYQDIPLNDNLCKAVWNLIISKIICKLDRWKETLPS